MPLYIYQAAYTPESVAAQIREPADRFEAVRPAFEVIPREYASAGRDHPITTPVTAAAKTCLRRRNACLPGTICRRLQITAVLAGLSSRLFRVRGRAQLAVLFWLQLQGTRLRQGLRG
jgi:hypothetical protein